MNYGHLLVTLPLTTNGTLVLIAAHVKAEFILLVKVPSTFSVRYSSAFPIS